MAACQGSDICIEEQQCQSGICGGGNALDCSSLTLGCTIGTCDTVNGGCTTETETMCIHGDDCCPSGCTASNDHDCCGLERFVLAELHVAENANYIAIRNEGTCNQNPFGLTLLTGPTEVETVRRTALVKRANGYRLFLYSDGRRVLELEPRRASVFDLATGELTEVPSTPHTGCRVEPLHVFDPLGHVRYATPVAKKQSSGTTTTGRGAVCKELTRQRAELVDALRTAGFGSRIDELEQRIRDTISITLLPKSKAQPQLGASRLGGVPDLPPGTPWPEAEGEPLSFVGQIALDDVAPLDVHDKLPSTGLLSYFFGDPLDDDEVPTAHARVIYVEHGATLEPSKRPKPPSWWVKKTPVPRQIAFAPLAMLPNQGEQPPRIDTEYRDFHDEFYDLGNHHPRHGMLCFDYGEPAHGPGEEILLRLDEDHDLPYSFDWCESVRLYVVMAEDALARRDFSAAKACLGISL